MEQREIDLLKGKGFEVETKLFGKKKIWRTKKMTLGRLIMLSELFLKMEVNEDAMSSDDYRDVLSEQYKLVHDNAKRVAKVMAICVTDYKWLRPFLTWHFLDNINSSELAEFTSKLLMQADYQNFMTSTVLMNGNRITKANTVE